MKVSIGKSGDRWTVLVDGKIYKRNKYKTLEIANRVAMDIISGRVVDTEAIERTAWAKRSREIKNIK